MVETAEMYRYNAQEQSLLVSGMDRPCPCHQCSSPEDIDLLFPSGFEEVRCRAGDRSGWYTTMLYEAPEDLNHYYRRPRFRASISDVDSVAVCPSIDDDEWEDWDIVLLAQPKCSSWSWRTSVFHGWFANGIRSLWRRPSVGALVHATRRMSEGSCSVGVRSVVE